MHHWKESGEQRRKSEAFPPTVVTVESWLVYKPEGIRAQPHFSKP